MDALSEFFENQTIWMAKINGLCILLGAVFLTISMLIMENGKPAGFVVGTFGMWLFGVVQIVSLYNVNEMGESKVRNASPFFRFICSVFHLLWFGILAVITVTLFYKILSR